jgi:hypothetical protein
VRANPWAADLDPNARARRHDHRHAVRILARAWLHMNARSMLGSGITALAVSATMAVGQARDRRRIR